MKKTLAGNDQLMQQFIDQLLKEQGFTNEAPEVLQELRDDLEKRINYYLDMAIASRIPEEKSQEFSTVLQTGSDKEIRHFIAQVIPDLDVVMTETLENFRDTYLGVN